MRVSTTQINRQALNQLLDLQAQTAATQQQIASGRKYQSAADEPLASVRVERLNRELAVREQFQKNITLAQNELELEESTLEQATNILQRVRELTVQAGNPINGEADRSFIAAEIETRMGELKDLLNTRLASGDYLFGGTVGGQPPFVIDAGGTVRYRGNEEQRAVQIDASVQIPVNDSGKRIFVDVPARRSVADISPAQNNAPGGSAVLRQRAVADQEALDALFPDALIVEFRPLTEDPDGLANFSVRRRSDQRPLEGLQNVRYEPGMTIDLAGVEVELSGQPRSGDRFVLQASREQDVLTTLAKLNDGLRRLPATGAADQPFQDLLADSLENLDNAMTSILEVRAEIGARLGVMESVDSLHEQVKLVSTELKSELQDVDFAEAISDLTLQSQVLQAAQQSFARLSQLTLFNAI